jgi:hypothetical protein
MIAALYVEPGGVYYGLPDVEPWGLPDRDAREYAGPWPVVAHPPCARWGRYWSGGPSANERRLLGDDNGCLAAAIWAVRTFGGVLEHPEASYGWEWFGLYRPPKAGLWVRADRWGFSCCVEQGHYGHRARKATWLYVCGVSSLPALKWGKSPASARLDQGFHSKGHRARAEGNNIEEIISGVEVAATPIPFRDLLLDIARSVKR